MKERPILFSGAMVRAILDGSKTQTRRVLKHQPVSSQTWGHGRPRTVPGKWCVHARFALPHSAPLVTDPPNSDDAWYPCPYGVPGDRLWVREAWAEYHDIENDRGQNVVIGKDIVYRADGEEQTRHTPWKPSIHMPRWASRITLDIVSVRVERLQEISEEDAKAEGSKIAAPLAGGWWFPESFETVGAEAPRASYKNGYQSLWESINGPGSNRPRHPRRPVKEHPYSWDANPWVWVVEFKRVEVDCEK